jgi:hypothetical protein
VSRRRSGWKNKTDVKAELGKVTYLHINRRKVVVRNLIVGKWFVMKLIVTKWFMRK